MKIQSFIHLGAVGLLLFLGGCAHKSSAPLPLAGTVWHITYLSGLTVNAPLTIEFDEQAHRLRGFAGIHNFSGTYNQPGQNFTAELGTATVTGEIANRVKLEQQYIGILNTVSGWRIDGHTLELFDGGNLVARFTAERPPK